ncbi:TPA: DUF2339 domain-containing protein [Elizabethkingia anophelis]|uniref:DUF2339 domain-containing protein n=1 Tax=Elizabethkingia TaxID=308865 RepID=UPI001628DCDD|nr:MULTISPECIES: DUF2339 domain-containing protein [Elizabethkingia]MCT3672996.1 DUF2339 domain-containing protein [Elizabethkingia anophelis]MCT3680515.1 DUF2339 domain-containing protein [Elizabethkingia anophelis]MCT3703592.1 DUF2339 domain-containing protein [Elizabethkingia anophelis]MCT3768177.1 DUF2339 domain-containing protein [Elizabethkingia anophelis]MCT3768217.1 DUF2339 domain-containing protein [Elizabethkingia anophelis]
MEIFLLLIILVFVIISLNKSAANSKATQEAISKLKDEINSLNLKIDTQTLKAEEPQPEIVPVVTEEPQPAIREEIKAEEEKQIIEENPVVEEAPVQAAMSAAVSRELQPETIPLQENAEIPVTEKIVLPPKKSWLQTFKEKNPDIEKFIGENLINKIGILILVLGISFFVKYAIDKNWINEPARVGIGILCGALIMGVAHRLKKNYKAFSSVFVAGSISIFYFTIGIAFHDYHLFNQATAFIIMVIITIFSAFVSVSYDRKELAVLSLIGGFAVPFMVSTGEGSYKVLFTYIAILNIGMLIIAYFKKWSLVTLLAFIFSCVLFSFWFGEKVIDGGLPYRGALFFATLFYLIFSIATVVNNLRNKGTFSKLEYFIIIVNTFFYFGIGISIIHKWGIDFKGLFTVALALYNLAYAILLYKKFGLDKNAIYLLLGLALTFVTLAIPIQFNGNYITLFWSAEAVLLFWLFQKSRIAAFKLGAIVVQTLMLFSLMMDWDFYYVKSTAILKPAFNPIFITGLVSLVSLILTYLLLRKEKEEVDIFTVKFNPALYRQGVSIAAIIVGYFIGLFEISYQANMGIANYYSAHSYSVLYHFLFSTGVIYFTLKRKNIAVNNLAIILSCINILLYIVVFHQLVTDEMKENYYSDLSGKSAFFIHYILLACLAYFGYTIIRLRNNNSFSIIINHKFALWVFAFCIVFIMSNEVMVHGLIFSGELVSQAELAKRFPVTKEQLYKYDRLIFIDEKLSFVKLLIIKIGYPILWGALSFVFLIIGIKKQNKQLRIIALALLGITIIKLFFYDIKNVSETGKIIAFILLGVLILIISFVYQKIKKLVIDESSKPNDKENN